MRWRLELFNAAQRANGHDATFASLRQVAPAQHLSMSSATSERIGCPVSLLQRNQSYAVSRPRRVCLGDSLRWRNPGFTDVADNRDRGRICPDSSAGRPQLPFHGSLQAVEKDVVAPPFLQVNGTGTGTVPNLVASPPHSRRPSLWRRVRQPGASGSSQPTGTAWMPRLSDRDSYERARCRQYRGSCYCDRRYGSIRRDDRRIHHPARSHSGTGVSSGSFDGIINLGH